MSKLSYWERRKANEIFHYMTRAEKKAEEISRLYLKASRHLSLGVDEIFERFQRKHRLSDAEARRLLNMLQDKTSIDELKKALKVDGGDQVKAEILAELESPAYQARIERLQQLQNQLDRTMQQVYQQEKVQSRNFYLDLGNEAYCRSVFDIQQMAGAAFSFDVVDPKAIEQVINSKWSGANYSQRIWNNTQTLAQDLKEELLINLVTGRTDREAAEIIADKFAVGASKARRLVRTESCNLANQMEMLSYEECGIETYIFLATLDMKTSETCRNLDGKRFLVKDQQPGKNCPPMHPWCRSTTICDISDEELAQMKRRARDPVTGKTKAVPGNITYPEWKKVVDEGGDFEKRETATAKPIAKDSGSGIIDLSDAKEVMDVHFVGKIDRNIYKCITEDIRTDEVIITDERILHVKERHPDDYERFCSYIPKIIQDPDYIVEANKENTAILLKEVTEEEEKFKLVLRISVKNDPEGYKNSVISFWHIGDTTWRKTLKNKNILYKKE